MGTAANTKTHCVCFGLVIVCILCLLTTYRSVYYNFTASFTALYILTGDDPKKQSKDSEMVKWREAMVSCLLPPSTHHHLDYLLSETFLLPYLASYVQETSKKVVGLHAKWSLQSSNLNKKWNILIIFTISNFNEICPLVLELFHYTGRQVN